MVPKITGADTWTHFIGSGALSYPWYDVVSHYAPEADVWRLSFTDGCDAMVQPDRVYALYHERVMRTVRSLARAYPDHWDCAAVDSSDLPFGASLEVMRQCALFLADPEYAGFDADTADQVMQVCAFGKVIYG